jgi:hypothetical protein
MDENEGGFSCVRQRLLTLKWLIAVRTTHAAGFVGRIAGP